MKILVFASLLLSLTTAANACSVCFRDNQSRGAYLATTGALISIPAAMVATFVIVIRRRMRQRESQGS